MNSLIVMVYLFAPWKLIYWSCQCSFLPSTTTNLTFLWATQRVFLEKQRTLSLQVHLVHAPSVLVESELLICFCYFVCIDLVTSCSLFCVSVFHVWSLSLDYFLLFSTRTLVHLITVCEIYERDYFQFPLGSDIVPGNANGRGNTRCPSIQVFTTFFVMLLPNKFDFDM